MMNRPETPPASASHRDFNYRESILIDNLFSLSICVAMRVLHCAFTFTVFFIARSPETSVGEYDDICDCQNGGTCDPLTGRCKCPPGVHGKTWETVGMSGPSETTL